MMLYAIRRTSRVIHHTGVVTIDGKDSFALMCNTGGHDPISKRYDLFVSLDEHLTCSNCKTIIKNGTPKGYIRSYRTFLRKFRTHQAHTYNILTRSTS